MSVKKKSRRKSSLKSDVVYDDDTSSSSSESENLEAFHRNYAYQGNTDSKVSSDADDESNENSSDDIVSASEDERFGPFEKPMVKEVAVQKGCINSKVDTLKSQLRSLNKVNSKCNQVEAEKYGCDMTKQVAGVSTDNTLRDARKVPLEEIVAEPLTKKPKWDGNGERDNEIQGEILESHEEDKERLAIRSELSKMSMEEILQLKETLGSKSYNRAMCPQKSKTDTASSPSDQVKRKHQKGEVLKRENKNRPRETSSKKTVKRYRDVVGLTTEQNVEKRDPRFDNLCGEFDKKEGYKFVDNIKTKELKVLREELVDEDDPDRIKQIKYLIQRMENQDREKKKIENEKRVMHEERKRNRQLLKDGKSPEFVSKEERQNKDLIEKYEELKKSNKLESYMKKKNRKNLSKERKKTKDY